MSTTNTELTFQVTGLDCANCAKSVETGVRQLAGVQTCELTFTSEKLRVTGAVEPQSIIDRVRELGFDVAGETTGGAATPGQPTNFVQFLWRRLDTRLALIGALLILPGLIFEELAGVHHLLINVASLAALALAGWPIARSAWRAIKINHEININVLMTIAALGAVIIGAYTEAGMVMVLFAI
ncbi:MAG TPA: cation transporter, partial [Anaerolineae bacterium]|nr:cation transporter [Anaerolineae bacterium]